jgi:hypothetical protein
MLNPGTRAPPAGGTRARLVAQRSRPYNLPHDPAPVGDSAVCRNLGTEVYVPATGTFALAGNMTTGRHSNTATLLPDGTVLIAGGYSTWPHPTSSAEIFKPKQ